MASNARCAASAASCSLGWISIPHAAASGCSAAAVSTALPVPLPRS